MIGLQRITSLIYHPRKDLMHLFWAASARRVAQTFLALFSPLYLFQVARDLGVSQRIGILYVFAYVFIVLVFKFITMAYAENLSQRVGFKKTVWFSTVPFFLLIPVLLFAAGNIYLFILVALLWGIHSGLYWWGYHGYFIKAGEVGRFGQGVGEAKFLDTTAVVLTPIIGALVTELFGFYSTFVLAGVFMLLAIIVLGRDHDKAQKKDVSLKEVFSTIKKQKSVALAYVGLNGEFTFYTVAWPLFLFLFFGRLLSLGIIVSLASFIAALTGILIGRFVDRKGEKKVVAVGAPLLAASWIVRVVNTTIPNFVFADSLRNFGERMVSLPLTELDYKKASDWGSAMAILFMETTFLIGGAAALLVLGVWVYFGGSILTGLLFSTIFGALPLIAVFKNKLYDR